MTTTATIQMEVFYNAVNPALDPIRDGTVKIDGVDIKYMPFANVIIPFRRMCRIMDLDISEQAVVCYYAARHYGLPVTAIPVFPVNWVEQGQQIMMNTKYAKTAKDLEGKVVGMRAYTVTPSTWQRAYLKLQGADLSKITFLSQDEEHVRPFLLEAPKNLVYQKGAVLEDLLVRGEIAAAFSVNVPDHPEIQPLNPHSKEDGIAQFKKDGIHHPIHLIHFPNRVVEKYPWLPRATYDAFKESKRVYIERQAAAGKTFEEWEDPMPMGLTRLRSALELLMDHCLDHGVIKRRLDLDEIFPGNFD